MAKKRTKAKSARRKKGRAARRPDMALQLMKVIGALAMLVLLVVIVAMMARFLIRRPQGYVPPVVQMPAPPAKTHDTPAFEIYPQKPLPPKPITKLPQLPGGHPPLVAIVIDDIGYDPQIAHQLLSLDAPLTFSVLPYGPFSRKLAAQARTQGHEIMLHLPMEPNEYPAVNPGPGALLAQMTPDQLIAQLERDLSEISGLKGVNNHMGSGISTSPERMRQIFSILKKHNLYYIDSRTTAETVARPSAELLKIPFAERDIFIDHFVDEGFISSQLKKLIKRAQDQGYAVGIAHPHAITLKVLTEFLPLLKEKVELVPASMVVEAEMGASLAEARAMP